MQLGRLTCLGLCLLLGAALLAACPGRSARSRPTDASAPINEQELRAKIDHVRSILEQWQREGKDPAPVYRLMVQIEPLLKKGRNDEAMAKLDEALAMVDPDYVAGAGSATSALPGLPPPAPGGPAGKDWTHATSQPLLSNLRNPIGSPSDITDAPVALWNDPSVMKEGASYSMWASLGLKGAGRDVSIYKLTSPDGLTWTLENQGRPVLKPGAKRDFDFFGVETPAVIKAGAMYHMYYTAYHDPHPRRGGHIFTMGHATSPDGVHWTKQGELSSLTRMVGEKKGNPWGWLARAEPAAVYRDGTFYLYFADVRCRRDNCKGRPVARRGISLATSSDGHTFRQIGSEPVLLQTASYPESDGWEGYSTPWVYHDGQYFQLYVDLFRHLEYGHFQTRIAHYRSEDGIHFDEVERDIIRSEGHPWARMSVRAPTVIEDGDQRMMWYAGDEFDKRKHKGKDVKAGRVRLGIGLATAPR